jgi:hypothetical protein
MNIRTILTSLTEHQLNKLVWLGADITTDMETSARTASRLGLAERLGMPRTIGRATMQGKAEMTEEELDAAVDITSIGHLATVVWLMTYAVSKNDWSKWNAYVRRSNAANSRAKTLFTRYSLAHGRHTRQIRPTR